MTFSNMSTHRHLLTDPNLRESRRAWARNVLSNTTGHLTETTRQLEHIDLRLESDESTQTLRDRLLLNDITTMHADLSSLQDSIQIILSQHASRYIAVTQHESNRRRHLTQPWQIDVDNFINAHQYKLFPISHVTGTSLAILEADLQSAWTRTHITLLEALHSQWLESIPTAAASNNYLNLPLTRFTKSLLAVSYTHLTLPTIYSV